MTVDELLIVALMATLPACTVTENVGELPASVEEEEDPASGSGTTGEGATSSAPETDGTSATGLEETGSSTGGTDGSATDSAGLEDTEGTTSWGDDGNTTEWTCETGCVDDCSSRENENYVVVVSDTEVVVRSGVFNSSGSLLDVCNLDEVPEQCGPRSVVVRFTVPSVTAGGQWTLPHPDVNVELLADYRTSDGPECSCVAQGEPFEITEGSFEIDADDPEFVVAGMEAYGLLDETFYLDESGDCG